MSNAEGTTKGDWAAIAAALPQAARAERERPFWRELAATWGWRVAADAGCGSGFHLGLLRELGVHAVGFDLAVAALAAHPIGGVVAGDLVRPPLRPGAFDAVLCLGNTLSLLPSRAAQREALAALACLVRPGGVVLLQGEDAGALVAGGPVVRTRRVDATTVHVRFFDQAGRGVRMLAGVVRDGFEAPLEEARLLPTSPRALAALGRGLPLTATPLPVTPPGGAGWWVAFSARST